MAAGSWFGLGKPEPEVMLKVARPHIEAARPAAERGLDLAIEAVFDFLDAHRPGSAAEKAKGQGRAAGAAGAAGSNGASAPRGALYREVPLPVPQDTPTPTVDAAHLPEPGALPRLNPKASMHKAWLLAEGPARPVDTHHGLVTLTFDDGPFPETTPEVLRLLAQYNIRATFFFIGRYLDGDEPRAVASRQVARDVVAAGHFVGNHTHDHHFLTLDSKAQSLAQIDAGAASIERATGKRPVLFRPPFGKIDGWVESVLRERKMELVLWNIEASDMRRNDVASMTASLKEQLEHAGGGVVLMHDIRPSSVAVLANLLEYLKAHRYDDERIAPENRRYELTDLATFMKATAASPQPYPGRAELEKARADDWRKRRPQHKAPPVVEPSEGHDVML